MIIALAYVLIERTRSDFYRSSALVSELVAGQEVIISDQLKSLAHAETAAALGRATQMLAHDVRSPLSRVRALIDAVRATPDGQGKVLLVESCLPDIDASLISVNAMVADVMDVSARRELNRVSCEAVALLQLALRDALLVRRPSTFDLNCDFQHVFCIDADPVRLQRALHNVLVNALEASGDGARITLSTFQSGPNRVEIVIRNQGSFLTENACMSVFDLFYTSGKPNGTGLGLAIVKKIVGEHGGVVVCRSFKNEEAPEGWVEFSFTLPAHEVASTIRHLTIDSTVSARAEMLSVRTESNRVTTNVRPTVAVLDDSVTFRAAWKVTLARDSHVHVFSHPDAFWQYVEVDPEFLAKLDIIVTDLHFSEGLIGDAAGQSFAADLRRRGFLSPIIVCTNDREFVAQHDERMIVLHDKAPLSWAALVHAISEMNHRG